MAHLRPLVETLRALATELAELADISDHLEAHAPSLPACVDAAWVERRQLADLLTQRLIGLTVFFDAAAMDAPLDGLLDVGAAIGGLKLSEQVRRFSGQPPTPPDAVAASGELFLFGE